MTEQFIVILENDGKKPMTTYYERRAALALKVRGEDIDENMSPLYRRSHGGTDKATIIQEGCIITPSHSQAMLVANLARQYGIRAVYVGTADLKPYEATEQDVDAFNRIQLAMSRKGRKPDPEKWVVTCYEEMLTFEVVASEVLLCPACHGTNIRARLGTANHVQPIHEGENILDYWASTRFPAGHYEIPVEDETALPNHPAQIHDSEEYALIEKIFQGQAGQAVALVPLQNTGKLAVLDAAFIARRYLPSETRSLARQHAFIAWIRDFKGNPMDFMLDENEDPDLIDLAALMGTDRTLHIFRAWQAAIAQ